MQKKSDYLNGRSDYKAQADAVVMKGCSFRNCSEIKVNTNNSRHGQREEKQRSAADKTKDEVKKESCYLSVPGRTTQIHLPTPSQRPNTHTERNATAGSAR